MRENIFQQDNHKAITFCTKSLQNFVEVYSREYRHSYWRGEGRRCLQSNSDMESYQITNVHCCFDPYNSKLESSFIIYALLKYQVVMLFKNHFLMKLSMCIISFILMYSSKLILLCLQYLLCMTIAWCTSLQTNLYMCNHADFIKVL